jgi:hypothetical protein
MKSQTPNSNSSSDPSNGRIVERIIENHGGNGGFNRLKDVVFLAVVLAAGGIIWAQQSSIDDIRLQIAVLNLKCQNAPVHRGANE